MLIKMVDKTDESIRLARSLGDRLNFMPDPLPKFDNPPVVETVLSAQFPRLPKFHTAHAGCFISSYLDSDVWPVIEEAARIEDQTERFGDDQIWAAMGAAFRFSSGAESQRTQITRSDSTRMIQIQDSRFIYNWKKGSDGRYPSYAIIKPEFEAEYAKFQKFVEKSVLGEIKENQWEVTYISQIPKGDLWNTSSDWPSIFPWLTTPDPASAETDRLIVDRSSQISGQRGRLHNRLVLGRMTNDGTDSLILTLTARGLVKDEDGFRLTDGFEIGHECIVRSFTAMTSKRAHNYWERTV
jgi:uncharacterized protein (TIGR04255 family)